MNIYELFCVKENIEILLNFITYSLSIYLNSKFIYFIFIYME